MKSISVFCGTGRGRSADYAAATEALARELARRRIRVVYGGGNIGLMGVLADAALAAGGECVGVIPRGLVEKELAHLGLSELRIVDTMAERKAEMARLSEGFIALPGGMGTLDELFEMLTFLQMGLHVKPCGLLDVGGYFAPLRQWLDDAVVEGFLRPEHRTLLIEGTEPGALVDRMAAFAPGDVNAWLAREVP